jgi:sulfonate dioxygenase
MAPALVDTASESLSVSTKAPAKTQVIPAFNKEFFVGYENAYAHENEAKGTEEQPAATYPNYLPVWDNETAR